MNSVEHTSTFRVRYYECDAYGHMNNANYLRYIQEAAFDASAAVGYDVDHYEQMGTVWLTIGNEVDFLKPLHYGDTVEVRTWVEDVQKVSSTRASEFRRVGEDELVARASTEWVYLNTSTNKPTRISDELVQAYFPGGHAHGGAPRNRFPKLPKEPISAFTMKRQVAWSDVDPQSHVNNATYFTYIEDAGIQVSAAFGWPMERYLVDGLGWFASKMRIKHVQEALLGDELEITTYLSDVKRASLTRNYVIRRPSDDQEIARAQALWAFTDVKTGRPARIPAELLKDFAENISGEDDE